MDIDNITTRQPTLRVRTSPNDANPGGDIFGGWLMAQIDIAGAIVAVERARGPVATVAVKELTFLKPIFVHCTISFYAEVLHIGKTSVTVLVSVYAQNKEQDMPYKVAEATLVYVAVEKPGVKRNIS